MTNRLTFLELRCLGLFLHLIYHSINNILCTSLNLLSQCYLPIGEIALVIVFVEFLHFAVIKSEHRFCGESVQRRSRWPVLSIKSGGIVGSMPWVYTVCCKMLPSALLLIGWVILLRGRDDMLPTSPGLLFPLIAWMICVPCTCVIIVWIACLYRMMITTAYLSSVFTA